MSPTLASPIRRPRRDKAWTPFKLETLTHWRKNAIFLKYWTIYLFKWHIFICYIKYRCFRYVHMIQLSLTSDTLYLDTLCPETLYLGMFAGWNPGAGIVFHGRSFSGIGQNLEHKKPFFSRKFRKLPAGDKKHYTCDHLSSHLHPHRKLWNLLLSWRWEIWKGGSQFGIHAFGA